MHLCYTPAAVNLNALRLYAAAALLGAVGCGGSSSGTPTTPSAPAPPPVPVNTWALAGTVVDTVGRQGISAASVAPSWDLGPVSADAAGGYMLTAVASPPNPYKLTVSADGFVTREQWVSWQAGPRSGITLDLIRNSAPFSMEFYRQLVRGTYDQEGAPWGVLRWREAPRFYFKTLDQRGRPLERDVVTYIRDALTRAVPEFTGGLYAATVETGTETRPDTDGWINVLVRYDRSERSTCGTAFVGRNPGEITLIINDVCSCGSIKVPGSVVLHEVGHALGFFHVPDKRSVMYPWAPGNCPSGNLSPAERYHAAIAYQRPRGNTDPDNDPSSVRLFSPGSIDGPRERVRN